MKAKNGEYWTKEDDKYVLDNYTKITAKQMAKKLNRTYAATIQRIKVLRGKGKIKQRERVLWTKEEEYFILENYNNMKVREMTKKLGKTAQQIHTKTAYFRKIGLLELDGSKSKYQIKLIEERYKDPVNTTIHYEKALEEEKKERDYGIGNKNLDIDFKKNKEYLLDIKSGIHLDTRRERRTFKGKLVQATHNHITFENKNRVRESFLRNDFLINEIQVKEM